MNRGDFIKMDDDVGIVVATGQELRGDLEDHTAVWFGNLEDGKPVLYTVPTEYLAIGPEPTIKH